jgi:hypothetical protein
MWKAGDITKVDGKVKRKYGLEFPGLVMRISIYVMNTEFMNF